MNADTNDESTSHGGSKVREQFAEEPYTPIKALSTFNYDWRIKARVTKKGERRSWKNQRSEGYLLNIELMDKHGT
jgi:replication factor A1